MKQFVYLILSLVSATNAHFQGPVRSHSRHKRDAVGALDIVTNNAQPIHAEVKSEASTGQSESTTVKVLQELHEEVKAEALAGAASNGTAPVATEKVTPPKDVSTVVLEYPVHLQSGRKSWPLNNRLDLVRSVSRMITLGVLLLSAAIELYPLVTHIIELYK